MRKEKLLIITITITFTLVALNFTTLPVVLGLEPIIHIYTYEDQNGKELIEIPEKGKTIDLTQNGLKRKFKKNPFKCWNWKNYLLDTRWQLPYKT